MKGLLLASLLVLTACTPAIQEAWRKEKQSWAGMDIPGRIGAVTGLDEAFPSDRTRHLNQEKELCWRAESHQRVVTVDGINDAFAYGYCLSTPDAPEPPKRLNSRPVSQPFPPNSY